MDYDDNATVGLTLLMITVPVRRNLNNEYAYYFQCDTVVYNFSLVRL